MLIINVSHIPRLEGALTHRHVFPVRQGIVNVLHALQAITLAACAQLPPHTAAKAGKDVARAPPVCNTSIDQTRSLIQPDFAASAWVDCAASAWVRQGLAGYKCAASAWLKQDSTGPDLAEAALLKQRSTGSNFAASAWVQQGLAGYNCAASAWLKQDSTEPDLAASA